MSFQSTRVVVDVYPYLATAKTTTLYSMFPLKEMFEGVVIRFECLCNDSLGTPLNPYDEYLDSLCKPNPDIRKEIDVARKYYYDCMTEHADLSPKPTQDLRQLLDYYITLLTNILYPALDNALRFGLQSISGKINKRSPVYMRYHKLDGMFLGIQFTVDVE